MSSSVSARDEILSTIRRSLGVNGQERPRVSGAQDRLDRSPKGLIPARGQLPPEEKLVLFKTQAAATFATVDEVTDPADIPARIAEYLRSNNLPARVRIAPDPRLADLPWSATTLETSSGISDGSDLIAVNHAFGAIAETGTLALVSGPDTPTTLNFLPDYAIAVVRASAIEGAYEQLWDKIREHYGKGQMPRTVNWVTGPSRSGDIEQILLMGAHGPRSVHIIIVRD